MTASQLNVPSAQFCFLHVPHMAFPNGVSISESASLKPWPKTAMKVNAIIEKALEASMSNSKK